MRLDVFEQVRDGVLAVWGDAASVRGDKGSRASAGGRNALLRHRPAQVAPVLRAALRQHDGGAESGRAAASSGGLPRIGAAPHGCVRRAQAMRGGAPFKRNPSTARHSRSSRRVLALSVRAGSAQELALDPTDEAALRQFPYCKCNDYKCKASPYRLTYVGAAPLGQGLSQFCYRMNLVRAAAGSASMRRMHAACAHARRVGACVRRGVPME